VGGWIGVEEKIFQFKETVKERNKEKKREEKEFFIRETHVYVYRPLSKGNKERQGSLYSWCLSLICITSVRRTIFTGC
jgi:hypothetical protein